KDVAVEVAVEVLQPLGNIGGQQGEGVAAQDAADLQRIFGADRRVVAQVGEREGGYSVAAVHGAEQRKQCLGLTNRQELAFRLEPAVGSKAAVERDGDDLAEILM